jgi:hypothetical protein
MDARAGAPLSRGNQRAGGSVLPPDQAASDPMGAVQREDPMTERDFEAKLAELDRLLNDPEVRMDPDRVWTLLAEISGKDALVPVRA